MVSGPSYGDKKARLKAKIQFDIFLLYNAELTEQFVTLAILIRKPGNAPDPAFVTGMVFLQKKFFFLGMVFLCFHVFQDFKSYFYRNHSCNKSSVTFHVHNRAGQWRGLGLVFFSRGRYVEYFYRRVPLVVFFCRGRGTRDFFSSQGGLAQKKL